MEHSKGLEVHAIKPFNKALRVLNARWLPEPKHPASPRKHVSPKEHSVHDAGRRPVTSCLGQRATVGSMQNHETLTVTTAEAARLLGISRNLAYEAARRGEIPTIRIGRRILVPLAALERLLSDRDR